MRVAVLAVCLVLAGCVSPFTTAQPSRINRPVNTVWVGADTFVYVPGASPLYNFTFETGNGRIIAPGLMYTDGGSIPRFAQIFKGFSPWGFGPAYIVHDWIFYAQHCYVDRGEPDKYLYDDTTRFREIYGYGKYPKLEFGDSADILAQVIKTIIDDGEVRAENVPATLISSAVDSVFALALWNEPGACNRQRVSPEHIAVLWVRHNGGASDRPPLTWRLSAYEIGEAKRNLPRARCLAAAVVPGVPRDCPGPVSPLVPVKRGGGAMAMAE
jgi:hypothetical protein